MKYLSVLKINEFFYSSSIKGGLVLAGLFGWLLSFPMFGKLLFETTGSQAFTMGKIFLFTHGFGLLTVHVLFKHKKTFSKNIVRVLGYGLALLTLLFVLRPESFLLNSFLFIIIGIVSSYLVLAWTVWFIRQSEPLLILAVSMAGANLVLTACSLPIELPVYIPLLCISVIILLSCRGMSSLDFNSDLPVQNIIDYCTSKNSIIKIVVFFAIAVYFVGGIWYEKFVLSNPFGTDWQPSINSLIYAVAIVFLFYVSKHTGQPGNLAVYSLSSLGVGLLLAFTGAQGPFLSFVYRLPLNFGLAASDLFYWYILWLLSQWYPAPKTFGLGLGFTVVLVGLTITITQMDWFHLIALPTNWIFIAGTVLIFFAVPLIFRPALLINREPNVFTDKTDSPEHHTTAPIPDCLTPTEKKVFCLLIEGAGDTEIAETCSISRHTVKFHVRNILRKMGVSNRKLLISSQIPSANSHMIAEKEAE